MKWLGGLRGKMFSTSQSTKANALAVLFIEPSGNFLCLTSGCLHSVHHARPNRTFLEFVDPCDRGACGGGDSVSEFRRVHLHPVKEVCGPRERLYHKLGCNIAMHPHLETRADHRLNPNRA